MGTWDGVGEDEVRLGNKMVFMTTRILLERTLDTAFVLLTSI